MALNGIKWHQMALNGVDERVVMAGRIQCHLAASNDHISAVEL